MDLINDGFKFVIMIINLMDYISCSYVWSTWL